MNLEKFSWEFYHTLSEFKPFTSKIILELVESVV